MIKIHSHEEISEFFKQWCMMALEMDIRIRD